MTARRVRQRPAPFTVLRGGQRPGIRRKPVTAPKFEYKRAGKDHRASNKLFYFVVRPVRDLRTGEKKIVIGRKSRTGQTEWNWKILSLIEYNHIAKKGKTSVSMLAEHPEVFTHIGKVLVHFLMTAA